MKIKSGSWFNNISLYRKILTIVTIAFFSICATYLVCVQVLSVHYDEELYRTNADALSHVTTSLEAELKIIETVSANIISNDVIQENLVFWSENQDSNRLALALRNTYEQLYAYMDSESYIHSINLVLPDGTNICMGNSDDIRDFDLDDLNDTSVRQRGRITWFPETTPGNTIACTRQIRQLKYFSLRNLAGLYIVVDIERMIEDALQSSGYQSENSSFILYSGQQRIYPENSDYDAYSQELLLEPQPKNNTYQIATINNRKEFIISGSLHKVDWRYIYFRDYNPLFDKLRAVRIRILIYSTGIILLTVLLVNAVFRSIFRHLDELIGKLRSFGLKPSVVPVPTRYDYSKRQDEIGQLHRSFDEMTQRVKDLRDDNYDKQLLLRDATIKRLQEQINPHFLYNTLDTINWMSQKYGADDISEMVQALGNLFRISISGHHDFISLGEELAVLDNYILIQKIRFRDRLDFELTVPDNLDQIYVPKLCIQPLVENALKHALEHTVESCTIQVTVSEQEHFYQIKVANTGSQFVDDLIWKLEHQQITPQGSGVGLVNINSRLKLLYGEHYRFTFYNHDEMAIAMLLIPKNQEVFHAAADDC